MRKLYAAAFPSLSETDARFIAEIRARHDRQVSVLGPHFTLVFGCDRVDEAVHAANLDDAASLCDELNADGVDIAGSIDALVVGAVEHGCFVELARIALRH